MSVCSSVHNERSFPEAKLDSEINARGDRAVLLHNNSVHIILFNVKKKITKIYRRKKRKRKRAQNRYFGMQIVTAKTTIV